jgi:hypothetical protein
MLYQQLANLDIKLLLSVFYQTSDQPLYESKLKTLKILTSNSYHKVLGSTLTQTTSTTSKSKKKRQKRLTKIQIWLNRN